jgi:hypothetical protein
VGKYVSSRRATRSTVVAVRVVEVRVVEVRVVAGRVVAGRVATVMSIGTVRLPAWFDFGSGR